MFSLKLKNFIFCILFPIFIHSQAEAMSFKSLFCLAKQNDESGDFCYFKNDRKRIKKPEEIEEPQYENYRIAYRNKVSQNPRFSRKYKREEIFITFNANDDNPHTFVKFYEKEMIDHLQYLVSNIQSKYSRGIFRNYNIDYEELNSYFAYLDYNQENLHHKVLVITLDCMRNVSENILNLIDVPGDYKVTAALRHKVIYKFALLNNGIYDENRPLIYSISDKVESDYLEIIHLFNQYALDKKNLRTKQNLMMYLNNCLENYRSIITK